MPTVAQPGNPGRLAEVWDAATAGLTYTHKRNLII